MLHKDLQASYWPLKISAFLMSTTVGIRLFNFFTDRNRGTSIPDMDCEEAFIPSNHGGPDIRIRIFKPLNGAKQLPGMLYIHGGGYSMGNPELNLDLTQRFIDREHCVIISPDYRRSLDEPYPAAFDDCYDTLLWMKEHAETLGVVPNNFIVGGHSTGGGLTAAVCLKAAETQDVGIAFQMPIYPMLDDTQSTPSAIQNNAPVWNSKANALAWHQYLRGLNLRMEQIPAYAAPARTADFSRLPPTITFVGSLEPFRDETITYVEQLRKAGVPVEFRLFEGCFHAFEVLVPNAEISKEAWRFVFGSYSDYIEKYILRSR